MHENNEHVFKIFRSSMMLQKRELGKKAEKRNHEASMGNSLNVLENTKKFLMKHHSHINLHHLSFTFKKNYESRRIYHFKTVSFLTLA